jgi:hypothetical protein
MSQTTPAASVEAHIASVQPHGKLLNWQQSKSPEQVMKAMSISAGSKKPGRVVKRVEKHLGGIFERTRVITWDKDVKFVTAVTLTSGAEADIVDTPNAEEIGVTQNGIHQTDLYIRTQGEHTVIDAVTVSSVAPNALTAVAEYKELAAEDINREVRSMLTAARVFGTGLEAAKILPGDIKDFLIPYAGGALEARNIPIIRTEFEERVPGQMISIRGFRDEATLSDEDKARIGDLTSAMTPAGYPGAEAYGDLVRANAR